jgi:hypothetical protein
MTAAQTSKSLYGYSAAYAPPEQIQGTGTEARSDLYALAATLYHLLTKVTPPEAFARTFQLSLGRPDPLTPADRVYPSVPRELSELLSRAMSLDIERRPASAAAMRAALRDAHAASVTRGPAATETDERPATPAQPAQGQQLAETVVPTSPAPSAQAVPQQQTPPAATQAQQYVRHEQRTTHAAPPPQPAARPAASKSRRWVWPALVLGSLLIAATIVVSFNSSGTGGANTTGGGTAATPSPGARPSPVSPSANGGAYVPTGDEGAVHGTVKFNGKAPERMPIPMDADANCLRANHNPMNEDFIVDSLGGLHNVFIYVRDGRTASGQALSELTFAPPSPLTLDRKGCQYVPHVIGIQTGQTLRVVNSDPTAHNLNVQPRSNDSFNLSQPPNSAAVERIFSRPEVMIPFKCNQHPWEKAYVGVLPHPFYVVSAQGAYEIRGLPPGTYTLVAWHERLGEKTQQITVGPHQNVTGVDFTYESRF